MSQQPTPCKYWPPTPLFLHLKKHRRDYRHQNGLYYEYN